MGLIAQYSLQNAQCEMYDILKQLFQKLKNEWPISFVRGEMLELLFFLF